MPKTLVAKKFNSLKTDFIGLLTFLYLVNNPAGECALIIKIQVLSAVAYKRQK